MAGLVVGASLMLASVLASRQDAQIEHDVIRISNICIGVRHGYEYTIVSNIDYFQVNVTYNDVKSHVYVGHNPQIIDENRKWQSRRWRATLKAPKVVPLMGAQAGQFLGVPVRENDKYFHLWFDGDGDGVGSTGPIKEIVGFCNAIS